MAFVSIPFLMHVANNVFINSLTIVRIPFRTHMGLIVLFGTKVAIVDAFGPSYGNPCQNHGWKLQNPSP